MMKMKAIVYTAPGEYSYTEIPVPEIKPDEILMRVQSCGLCRTDMHIHKGHFLSEFPLTNGHEFAGVVEKTGDAVQGFQIGDRIVADNTELCGHCFHCQRDEPLFCENFVSHGCNCAGGFAEYLAIKAEKSFKIDTLSWREAVMVEPTACAMHGMDIIDLAPGSDVLLFGAGPTALILAQLLKQNGAVNLVVAAPAGAKLDLMKKLAADHVIEIDKADSSKHQQALLDQFPHRFDAVIEATGVAQLFADSIQYARKGGQIIAYGEYDESQNVEISPSEIFMNELTVKGSFAQTHCFDRAVNYLESGAVRVDEIVTHELPLADYGKALDMMNNRVGIKIALLP